MVYQSYKNLDIYKKSHELVIEIHNMTIKNLPSFEMYEEASQIRKSSKSIKSNIVEGFGRRRSWTFGSVSKKRHFEGRSKTS